MTITELTPLAQKAALAYEAWVDIGNNRYGTLHREAFVTAFEIGWEGGSRVMYDMMVKADNEKWERKQNER
ncbi:MAG: hypothetical protein WBI20_15005 [Burkholderiaceae bacterium]